jgi:hypothetical protein
VHSFIKPLARAACCDIEVKLKGLKSTPNIGARNKTTYRLGGKLVDINPSEIVFVCDLFNEEQKQVADYMAHDKLIKALYPLPGEDIV